MRVRKSRDGRRLSAISVSRAWSTPSRGAALPHARLRAIDTTAAASAPGVLAVLTAADLADCDRFFGPAYKDQPILAIDRVRYAGEPVVAVVAHSEREAAAAVALLEVDLEELPAVTTLDEALAPEAPYSMKPCGGRPLSRSRQYASHCRHQHLSSFSPRAW